MKQIILLSVLTLAVSAAVQAQPHNGSARPMPPILQALDANGDGIIDSNEIANASAALKTLDTNGDGQLTHDELMPGGHPAGAPDGVRPHRVMPLVAALDTDTNGVISAEEIANAPASLKALDKNGDGQLTRDELFPKSPGGFASPRDDQSHFGR
jgi:Ca2+-binding EF-hand superfamily protein